MSFNILLSSSDTEFGYEGQVIPIRCQVVSTRLYLISSSLPSSEPAEKIILENNTINTNYIYSAQTDIKPYNYSFPGTTYIECFFDYIVKASDLGSTLNITVSLFDNFSDIPSTPISNGSDTLSLPYNEKPNPFIPICDPCPECEDNNCVEEEPLSFTPTITRKNIPVLGNNLQLVTELVEDAKYRWQIKLSGSCEWQILECYTKNILNIKVEEYLNCAEFMVLINNTPSKKFTLYVK